jgi:hypothetical protein
MDRRVAFILLDKPSAVDVQAVVQAIHARYPGLSAGSGRGVRRERPRCRAIGAPSLRRRNSGRDEYFGAPAERSQGRCVGARGHDMVGSADSRQGSSLRRDRWNCGRSHASVAGSRHRYSIRRGMLDTVPGCSAVMRAARVVERLAALRKFQTRKGRATCPDHAIIHCSALYGLGQIVQLPRVVTGIGVLNGGSFSPDFVPNFVPRSGGVSECLNCKSPSGVPDLIFPLRASGAKDCLAIPDSLTLSRY